MFKKTLFALALSFAFFGAAHADATVDYSLMNPTVKVVAYKKLYTDNVIAIQSGSGTVISPDGLIITNHHVIYNDDEQKPYDAFGVCITFDVKEEPVCTYQAELIKDDTNMDIAILKMVPTDVFGHAIPALKFLDYKTGAAPKEGDKVQIMGYPASGGDTITITAGQISGFDTYNNFKYFKTDTVFDHGSSGGTALDMDGHYIGIPTYIRSYAENIGYFLDLRQAFDWIDQSKILPPQVNNKAEALLSTQLAALKKANDSLAYTTPGYPNMNVTLPAGWKFSDLEPDGLYAEQKTLSNPASVAVYFNAYQYKIDEGYLKKVDEELQKTKQNYPDYKKTDVTFAGQKAWKISYTAYNSLSVRYLIPYGTMAISISYSIDLDKDQKDKQLAAVQPVLDSIKFLKSPMNDLPTGDQNAVAFDDPPFKMAAVDGWKIMKNPSTSPIDLLAEAVQKGNFEGSFSVSYGQIPKDEQTLSTSDLLDQRTKNLGSRKLIYKNDSVTLDGLKGYVYTTEYDGDKYQEVRKNLLMKIMNGDHQFTFVYDDRRAEFDKNLPAIRQMLESFRFIADHADGGKTDLGTLDSQFTDLNNHPYAAEILDLQDKGLLSDFSAGAFEPEQQVTRGQTLKIILESKNHLEDKKGSGKTVDFKHLQNPRLKNTFKDLKPGNPLSPYIGYAYAKKWVNGYANHTFRPDQSVTLGEALKWIFSAYEIPVWEGATNPWNKKYMGKGYELGLIPYGVVDPEARLSRGELAFMVSRVYKQADDQNQYGMGF